MKSKSLILILLMTMALSAQANFFAYFIKSFKPGKSKLGTIVSPAATIKQLKKSNNKTIVKAMQFLESVNTMNSELSQSVLQRSVKNISGVERITADFLLFDKLLQTKRMELVQVKPYNSLYDLEHALHFRVKTALEQTNKLKPMKGFDDFICHTFKIQYQVKTSHTKLSLNHLKVTTHTKNFERNVGFVVEDLAEIVVIQTVLTRFSCHDFIELNEKIRHQKTIADTLLQEFLLVMDTFDSQGIKKAFN